MIHLGLQVRSHLIVVLASLLKEKQESSAQITATSSVSSRPSRALGTLSHSQPAFSQQRTNVRTGPLIPHPPYWPPLASMYSPATSTGNAITTPSFPLAPPQQPPPPMASLQAPVHNPHHNTNWQAFQYHYIPPPPPMYYTPMPMLYQNGLAYPAIPPQH